MAFNQKAEIKNDAVMNWKTESMLCY